MDNKRKTISIVISVALVFAMVVGSLELFSLMEGKSFVQTALASGADSGSSSSSSSSSSSGSTTSGGTTTTTKKKSTVKKKKLSVKGKTYTVSADTLQSKSIKVSKGKLFTIKNAGGKTTYKITKVSKSKKFFKINKKNGKLSIKKGLKAGTYTLKVKVKTTGNKKCKAGTKTVKVKIMVEAPAPAPAPALSPEPAPTPTPDSTTPTTPDTGA